MPTEAKLGLVLGIGLTITLAILARPKADLSTPQPTSTLSAQQQLPPSGSQK
jgi:hypothetical protein